MWQYLWFCGQLTVLWNWLVDSILAAETLLSLQLQHAQLFCPSYRSIYRTSSRYQPVLRVAITERRQQRVHNMASLEDGFKQVMLDFKKRLRPEEEAQFEFTTLNELEKAVNNIQERQRKSKTAQNLNRIKPFLQAMAQYKDIIEVFLNTSTMLCFVWGPMKFMLLVSKSLRLWIPFDWDST